MVIYPHHLSYTSWDSAHIIISELCHPGFPAITLVWIQRQIAAVVADIFWVVRISEALEHIVNTFDLI